MHTAIRRIMPHNLGEISSSNEYLHIKEHKSVSLLGFRSCSKPKKETLGSKWEERKRRRVIVMKRKLSPAVYTFGAERKLSERP